MMYLSDCSHVYATNNKLEEEVSELMKTYSRVLCTMGLLESFKKAIIEGIEFKNTLYPRCKPVRIDFEVTIDHVTQSVDYIVRWNNYPESNGKHIVEFKLICSK